LPAETRRSRRDSHLSPPRSNLSGQRAPPKSPSVCCLRGEEGENAPRTEQGAGNETAHRLSLVWPERAAPLGVGGRGRGHSGHRRRRGTRLRRRQLGDERGGRRQGDDGGRL